MARRAVPVKRDLERLDNWLDEIIKALDERDNTREENTREAVEAMRDIIGYIKRALG